MKYGIDAYVRYYGKQATVYDYSHRFKTYTLIVEGTRVHDVDESAIQSETYVTMAEEFKRLEALENESAEAGNIESAERYLKRKWDVMREAERMGLRKEVSDEIARLEQC
jgi:allophanate hydrolase subunit 2